MSNNISFETGLKYFTINGDPDRKIYFDPNDIGIVDRIEEAAKSIQERAQEIGTVSSDEEARAALRDLEAFSRNQVDAVFPTPVCDIVFGNACCVSVAPSGKLYIESFLESIAHTIRRESKGAENAAKKRQAKYLDKYENRQNFNPNRNQSGKRQ